MTTADQIRAARIASNMTQSQLAEIIKTTQCNVSRYESGDMIPGLDRIRQLAAALGLKVADLVDPP